MAVPAGRKVIGTAMEIGLVRDVVDRALVSIHFFFFISVILALFFAGKTSRLVLAPFFFRNVTLAIQKMLCTNALILTLRR